MKVGSIACGYGHTLVFAENAEDVEGMDAFEGGKVVKGGAEKGAKKAKA